MKQTLNRLCIFVIYDKEKKIDSYISFLLDELKCVSDRVVIICNFEKTCNYPENIGNGEIYFRENIGYDAGAYKYALFELLSWDEIYKYDELLLTNDTYFGPFYSFKDMFEVMSAKKCDYWGITRHPEGNLGDGYKFSSHIQSYFVNFKRSVLHSNIFKRFWLDLPVCKNIEQAIRCFEIRLSEFLTAEGFKGISYIDDSFGKLKFNYNENPYLKNSLELIRDYKMPVLKKKSIDLNNKWFANSLGAVMFVKKNLNYDVSLIENHMNRLQQVSDDKLKFDFYRLSVFVHEHKRLYIYGDGVWAKNMDVYFKYKGWTTPPHIVSQNEKGQNIQVFDDIYIGPDDGIIIAVSKKEALQQIMEKVLLKCKEEQVIYPKTYVEM